MATILGSLNYNLQLDKDAQHILENSHNNNNIDYTTSSSSINTIALTSTPTITTLDSLHSATTTRDFLHKLGATFINSIHLNPQTPLHMPAANPISGVTTEHLKNMDFPLTPPQIVINTDSYGTDIDELQKQLEYDKIMNEVWIGIVLTLILISMVFCFCSCFLYHQFRVWKRNYRSTLTQNLDSDNVKISMDIEDPVPEYTLVSGLPSYDAALELLQKNPKSCLIVHPSVFEIFNKQEKSSQTAVATPSAGNNSETNETSAPLEAAMPLLNSETLGTTKAIPQVFMATLPSYSEATSVAVSLTPLMPLNHGSTSLSMVNEKSQLKSSTSKNNPNNNEKSTK